MAKEKLRIIKEAETIGNLAEGRKYDVSESCIRDWRKNKTEDDALWQGSSTFTDGGQIYIFHIILRAAVIAAWIYYTSSKTELSEEFQKGVQV